MRERRSRGLRHFKGALEEALVGAGRRLVAASRHTNESLRFSVVKLLFVKKFIGTLMAVLLLGVQMHLCSPTFQFADGRQCETCPTLSHPETPESSRAFLTDGHGDCHDCCVLTACHDDETPQSDLLAQSAFSLVIDIPKSIELPTGWVVRTPRSTVHFIAGCPPTGPPGDASPRGPPFFQVV